MTLSEVSFSLLSILFNSGTRRKTKEKKSKSKEGAGEFWLPGFLASIGTVSDVLKMKLGKPLRAVLHLR